MSYRKLTLAILPAALMIGTAHAGGLIADVFVKPFNSKAAAKIDEAHAKVGRPLDKAFQHGLNQALPGAGDVWRAQDKLKRLGVVRK